MSEFLQADRVEAAKGTLDRLRANMSRAILGKDDVIEQLLVCLAAGGHLTVLATPPDVELTPAEVWGPSRPAAALMRSIQQRFDPAGILNPGRLCFGSDS